MNESVKRTIENLRKNKMTVYFAESSAEALEIAKTLIPSGASVSHGGAVTLEETGVKAYLKAGGDFDYIDRETSPEKRLDIMRRALMCDVYFSSANAITENGEIYNVDGNSNRTAALLYGPESVVIIAGTNKIVPDIKAAVERVRTVAAPKNAVRLHKNTYCAKTGKCVACGKEMGQGCGSDERICCNFLVMAQQRFAGKVKVILVDENLGY